VSSYSALSRDRIDGVVIGIVAATKASGETLVAYSGNQSELPIVAKTTVSIDANSIGREVALMFENGDLTKPIIMGIIYNEALTPAFDQSLDTKQELKTVIEKQSLGDMSRELTVDGKRIQLRATDEIMLKCGKSSITMTRAGKVIIRGTYISTKSSGTNRIKGGSVHIN